MSDDPSQPTPSNIGPYTVERELGRGGMGVVYLARDPKLNRLVAVKVLPPALVADPMRLERFEREARILAALNHRNIGMIFGLEDDGSQRLLVLEYIPGRSLTEIISRGPLNTDDTLRLAIQLAEALEVAHDRAVVHRDLKPDNLRITPDGMLKVLDFGLATASHNADVHPSATGSHLTQAGMVMGTPGYMSPEQARGLPTDKRTDIWAFGCVLYECVTGYRAFLGETASDCIAMIIERDPDFSLIPARAPNRLRDILRRCLTKDQRRRTRDIGDVRIELEEILAQPQSGWYQAAGASGARASTVARLTMPLDASGASSTGSVSPSGSAPSVPGALSELGLSNSTRSAVAIAPDGSSVVFVTGKAPQTMLYIRRMDGQQPRLIPGTNGADAPFFSPDGQKVGFFADGKLKRVNISGGAPLTMCPAPRPCGACWDTSEFIYFIPDWQRGVQRISSAGGTPETVLDPDLATGELGFMNPEMLPGSRHLLLSVFGSSGAAHDESVITAIDIRSKARHPLIQGGWGARALASGHIVFARSGSLYAVAFNPETLEIFGSPVSVEDRILGNALGGSAQFACSAEGTLVFASGSVWEPKATMLLSPRSGTTDQASTINAESRPFISPTLSPSGKLLVVQVQGSSDHLYAYDLDRPQQPGTKLTFLGDNASPIFAPDGSRMVFRSTMPGRAELYLMGVDASGPGAPEPLYGSDFVPTPCGFADGGRTVLFTQQRASAAGVAPGLELWAVSIDDPSSARLILQSQGSITHASASPDNRLIAYVSDESGRPEVYVHTYTPGQPLSGARRQVSTEGATAPIWARSGGEVYYRQGDQIIASRIAVEPNLMVGRPRSMYQCPGLLATPLSRNYAITPEGQFIFLRTQEDHTRVSNLQVILNWFSDLRRRVPVPTPAAGSRAHHSNIGGYASNMPGGSMSGLSGVSGAGMSGGGMSGVGRGPLPQAQPPLHSTLPTRMSPPIPSPAPKVPPRPTGPSEANTLI